MAKNIAAYLVDDETPVDPEWVKRVFGDLDNRIDSLEEQKATVDEAVAELQELGLERIDEVLAPAFQEVQDLANLGVLLSADSDTSVAIATGSKSFTIVEDDRDTFAPASYLIIRSKADSANAMSGFLTSYDRETGALVVDVQQANGSGTHADWEVTVGALPDATHAGRTDNPHTVTAAQ
ncbi:MAG: hypothetical protein ACR2PA_22380, partial [Hyphomicrobiaceae bacterium]